jgi:hypothetical protein
MRLVIDVLFLFIVKHILGASESSSMSGSYNSSGNGYHYSNGNSVNTNGSIDEKINALTLINARLETELREQRTLIKRICEIILPSLNPNTAEQLRTLMKAERIYDIYGW